MFKHFELKKAHYVALELMLKNQGCSFLNNNSLNAETPIP
jgi:hypothetical protein